MSIVKSDAKINNEALVGEFLSYIAEGASEGAACGAVGLHPMTYAKWLQKGYNDPEAVTMWGQFYLKVLRAKSIAEMRSTQSIADARDWKAQAWLLERRNPESWSEKQRSAPETTGPSPDDIAALRLLSTEELEKALQSGHIAALLESNTIEVEGG